MISLLIDGNPLSMMYDNHRHHIEFISNVFKFNSFDMIEKILPWVYHTYGPHGFSFDYFPLELEAWNSSIKRHLQPPEASEVTAIYDWIIKQHQTLIELSTMTIEESEEYCELASERKEFGACLLTADYIGSLKIAKTILERKKGLEAFYVGLVKPIMYEIGKLWEDGKISTAEEHLATATVNRILSAIYEKLPFPPTRRGKAIVTCAPNEYHELGARIVADIYLNGMDGMSSFWAPIHQLQRWSI